MPGKPLAHERSLEYHRVVAEILRASPERIDVARERVRQWRATSSVHPYYAEPWQRLVEGPLEELLALLVEDSERAIDLRHASPFAGYVDPRQRWKIWREVKERFDARTGCDPDVSH